MYKELTLEILATFKSNFIPILKIMILPVLLLIGLSSISNYLLFKYINSGTSGLTVQIAMSISTLSSILIGIVLLMTMYKCILEDNQENKSFTAFFKAFKSKDAKWFILNSILITIGFALVSAVIFFAIGFLSSLIITGGKISGPIVTIIGLTLAIMIYARVIIILPAAATGNRINLFEAFRLTRNYKLLTLFAVFVMPFLFVAILSAISVLLLTGLTYIIQDLSIIFFTFIFNTIYATTIAIFTNICIAILYKHIKQDSIEDTSKQVEEIETESKEINKED